MDMDELEKKLKSVDDEEIKDNVKHVFKVKEIMQRRLKSLTESDYGFDEILLGTALAVNEGIKEVDSDKRVKLRSLVEKIINM